MPKGDVIGPETGHEKSPGAPAGVDGGSSWPAS